MSTPNLDQLRKLASIEQGRRYFDPEPEAQVKLGSVYEMAVQRAQMVDPALLKIAAELRPEDPFSLYEEMGGLYKEKASSCSTSARATIKTGGLYEEMGGLYKEALTLGMPRVDRAISAIGSAPMRAARGAKNWWQVGQAMPHTYAAVEQHGLGKARQLLDASSATPARKTVYHGALDRMEVEQAKSVARRNATANPFELGSAAPPAAAPAAPPLTPIYTVPLTPMQQAAQIDHNANQFVAAASMPAPPPLIPLPQSKTWAERGKDLVDQAGNFIQHNAPTIAAAGAASVPVVTAVQAARAASEAARQEKLYGRIGTGLAIGGGILGGGYLLGNMLGGSNNPPPQPYQHPY